MPIILYCYLQGLRLTLGCIQSQWIWLQRDNFTQSNNWGPRGCEEAVWTSFRFCKYRRIFCIRRFGQQSLCANSSVHPFIWRGKFPAFILNFRSSHTGILPDWNVKLISVSVVFFSAKFWQQKLLMNRALFQLWFTCSPVLPMHSSMNRKTKKRLQWPHRNGWPHSYFLSIYTKKSF